MQAYSHVLSDVCVTRRQWVLALFLERYDYVSISHADSVWLTVGEVV